MEIRDGRGAPVENPDLSFGHIEIKTETVHREAVEAVEETGHWETVSEYANGGKDVEWIVDTAGAEAVAAYDEQVEYGLYVPYTKKELDEIDLAKTRLDDIESSICELYELISGGDTGL